MKVTTKGFFEKKHLSGGIPDTREEKAAFLAGFFRYFTLNSWNRSNSYALNVKVYNLGLTEDLTDIAYEFDEFDFEDIRFIFEEFEEENPGFSLGFNGRSCGYVVIYQKENGVCHPGRGLDMDYVLEDYLDEEEWSDYALNERCELLQNFLRTMDKVRDIFIEALENYSEEEEGEYFSMSVEEKFNYMVEMYGSESLLGELYNAMDDDEMEENLDHIYRSSL